MINKLIIIGIDGLDIDVIQQYRSVLPNISKLITINPSTSLRSVFPADTVPAWSTVYTGMDPSEHGIINFVNVGVKDNTYRPLEFNDNDFIGKTFWDKLNRDGKSCAVILPMNIKKGWEIDGLMITQPLNGKINVYPQAKEDVYKPCASLLGTEGKFTSNSSLGALKEEFFSKQEEEFRLTKLAIENETCDVLFSYFSTTDGVQHDFWKHCDTKHPHYPGDNIHQDVIKEMYIRMDECVGEIIELQPYTPLLIFSDHGHGARPVYLARINEMLKRGGYLSPKVANGNIGPKKKMKKLLKKTALAIVKKVGLPKVGIKIAKKFPIWKNLFASGSDFDWSKTVAYLSDLSALKNYSYGGIRISEFVEDKDALADEIINYLEQFEISEGKKPLFQWIRRTNTFYKGKYLSRYPEIIFQMDERYGGEWELGERLLDDQGFMFAISPGGHRWNTATLLSNKSCLEKKRYEMDELYDLIIKMVGQENIDIAKNLS